jgi:16S rRNA (guanine527-N7)-methyltransferase
LTAIVDYEEVQIKHFLDSLTVALALEVGTQTDASFHVIDIGTGAGMPGVPFKILFPDVRLVLLDSVGKKTSFLNHLVAKLGLSAVEVLTARAEDLAREEKHREIYDLVLSRAVAELPTLVELTLPFCKIGGIFVAQKKGLIEEEIKRAQKAIELLGGRLREAKEIKVNALLEEQLLIIIEKIAPTVSHYPRRAGIPTKRPL